MVATLEPAKRIIDQLLKADARYFEEHHYLDPVLLGPPSELNIELDIWKDVCII
jgi:hypothetical protein